ncbi:MAG: hypothetical protein R3199_12580 [Gemmatimonadota bacterium]|nr:hypothetical protein [Gemmatimonadota bacterium]
MRDWRADFREMADDLREEDGPEPVARLLEHIGDLGHEQVAQLQAGPWKRDLEALEYDELTRASAILNRLRDRARDTNRAEYVEGLDRILATVEAEVRRR